MTRGCESSGAQGSDPASQRHLAAWMRLWQGRWSLLQFELEHTSQDQRADCTAQFWLEFTISALTKNYIDAETLLSTIRSWWLSTGGKTK